MKRSDVETEADLIEYYEELLDYLDDCIPCLGEVISQFNEGEDD
jgi:hypothetical protein